MKAKKPLLKLDISYGDLPKDHPFLRPAGFDSTKFPWPFKDESVEEAYSGYLFQHVHRTKRMQWMDELWRVLKPGGTATILVPYWSSARAVQDPTAEWPPLCENSFLYFNKQFRKDNHHADAKCDFDFTYGQNLAPETAGKSDDVRPFWINHYLNAANDVQVVLSKRK